MFSVPEARKKFQSVRETTSLATAGRTISLKIGWRLDVIGPKYSSVEADVEGPEG